MASPHAPLFFFDLTWNRLNRFGLSIDMDTEQYAGSSAAATASANQQDKRPPSPPSEENSIAYGGKDLLHGEKVDEVLAAKMALVNDVSDIRRRI